MATADPAMAQVTLRKGHSLRGRDVLPVVMRLSSLSLEDWEKRLETHPLASFSNRHALESYSGDELGSEFRKLTGYDITVSVTIGHCQSLISWLDFGLYFILDSLNMSQCE
jgi:hypothetical protein